MDGRRGQESKVTASRLMEGRTDEQAGRIRLNDRKIGRKIGRSNCPGKLELDLLEARVQAALLFLPLTPVFLMCHIHRNTMEHMQG